jgi:hypothetical protein
MNGLTVDQLGDEIATLAAHLSAATCRWLELLAEFDERGGWADHGCKSCAHWVSWRCSMAPSAAREHVRVARRLRELPLVRAAFGGGELSFSKVRALARIEEIEREEDVLELARVTTAAQLERTVRAYRGVTKTQATDTHERRFLSFVHEENGSVRVTGRLSHEDAAIVEKALDVVRGELLDAARPERRATSREDSAESRAATPGERSAELAAHGNDSAESRGWAAPPEVEEPGARAADALVALADAALASLAAAGGTRNGGDRFQVVVHVDADTLRDDARGRCETDVGEPLAAETVRRLACDASVIALVERGGRPLTVGRKVSWLHATSPRRRAPHRPLGPRRRDEAHQPRRALRPPPPAAPRGRLHRRALPRRRRRTAVPPPRRPAAAPRPARAARRPPHPPRPIRPPRLASHPLHRDPELVRRSPEPRHGRRRRPARLPSVGAHARDRARGRARARAVELPAGTLAMSSNVRAALAPPP